MAQARPHEAQAGEALRRAAELRAPLLAAARRADVYAAGYLVVGGITALFGLMGPDTASVTVGLAVAAVGWDERRQARLLRRGEPGAARALARDELVLLGVVAVYCAACLTFLRADTRELQAALGGSLQGLDVQALADRLTNIVYPTVFVVSLVVQGLLARHYAGREPEAARYREEAPDWAREALESAGG
jgi:hypothetical protein